MSGRLRGAPWAAGGLCLLVCVACGDGEASRIAAFEPAERLPGGTTTNTLLRGANAFTPPADNLSDAHELEFFTGNSFFNQGWVEAGASTESRDGLGPLFNARSCAGCHFKDGRGRPPERGETEVQGFLVRLSVPGADARGGPVPEPRYGGQLQPFALPGVPAEGQVEIHYEEVPGQYGDGEAYSLARPSYRFVALGYGALADDVRFSPRTAQALIGLGLLEAVPEERLVALADPDDVNGDGVSGRIHHVWDQSLGRPGVGRFGWKAEQPSVLQQVAGAFLGDIGITSSLNPEGGCQPGQQACRDAASGGAPEIADRLLERVSTYSRTLAVPVRDAFDSSDVLRGKYLFTSMGCADCHVPSHRTGKVGDLPELSEQLIFPYTDLLLHDMGDDLSDERPVFEADGPEWRTAPLWGLRYYRVVNRHERLLHDGRARGVAEAILWHGGEGEMAREAFREASRAERAVLVEFVESL